MICSPFSSIEALHNCVAFCSRCGSVNVRQGHAGQAVLKVASQYLQYLRCKRCFTTCSDLFYMEMPYILE